LKTLTPREERIIKMRSAMDDGSGHTLEEVGNTFAVTRERIPQIEVKPYGNCVTRHDQTGFAASWKADPTCGLPRSDEERVCWQHQFPDDGKRPADAIAAPFAQFRPDYRRW